MFNAHANQNQHLQPVHVCSRCVMDTSDPEITFDEKGVCNHCLEFDEVTSKRWFPNEQGKEMLQAIITRIKQECAKQEYDCILGLSGGVDSSYLALKVKEYGLRALAVHVDAGWNSEMSVHNIEKLTLYCGFDLYTHVVDWEEIRDLQLAYLKSGVANQDVPQDHVFFASLYKFAVKHKIRYVLSGGNIATEGIFPRAWEGDAMDKTNLLAIHRKYGTRPLKTYNTVSFFEYYFLFPFVYRMRVIRPLDYMPYNRADAIDELQKKIGWKSYGRKHGESRFTKFFQNYYEPTKFGYDKRKAHLSSLIVSKQITREDALTELAQPLYSGEELEDDIEYFIKKLGISEDEFQGYMTSAPQHYLDFPNQQAAYHRMKRLQVFLERLIGRSLSNYG